MIGSRQVVLARISELPLRRVIALTVIAIVSSTHPAWAQDADKNEKKLGWTNSSDFSLVITSGNSKTQTLGLSDQLRYTWPAARFSFDATGVFSKTSDDWFFLVDPGLQFPVGAPPQNPSTTLIKPEPKIDVSKFLLSGQFDRNFTPRFFWNVGASWDHNRDAGIIRRYIAFAGLGNTWADNQRRRFSTTYGLSYTDRKEDKPDPEKEPRFPGARLGWTYTERFSKSTAFDSNLTSNIDLSDVADYSIQTTNSLSVAMNSRLSLKVSLQWLFENQPALETGLDVVVYAELVNPDGIPSSGDEYYRTVSSAPTKIVIGSADARKDKLDTIFRTALVIKF
jgi:putative salt-induced outer membrane protein YdiY